MRKHCFHSLLSIFFFTAGLTILGKAELLPIREQYLDLLVIKLLVEVAILTTLLAGRRFFLDDAPPKKPSRPKRPSPSTRISARPQPIEKPPLPISAGKRGKGAIGLQPQPERLALTAPAFFKKNARLKDRPSERDRWIESVSGKQVTWHGTIVDVQKKDSNLHLSLSVCSILEKFNVIADFTLADVISSFQKGDFIMVEGVFEESDASPRIRALSVNRLNNDG